MIKPKHYHQTIEILYHAHLNNTLETGNLYAGAVGNLVAAALGYQFTQGMAPGDYEEEDNYKYTYLVWVKDGIVLPYPNYAHDGDIINGWNAPILYCGENRFIKKDLIIGPALEQISATGYKATELSQIDKAFQSHNYGPPEDRVYYGLIKVLEVLQKIHYVTDENLIERNILRFKSHYQSLLKQK